MAFGYDFDYAPVEVRHGRAFDLRLGIDVGGTNTDAVVLDTDSTVLAAPSSRPRPMSPPASRPRSRP